MVRRSEAPVPGFGRSGEEEAAEPANPLLRLMTCFEHRPRIVVLAVATVTMGVLRLVDAVSGKELLRVIAQSIQGTLRVSDTVARLGGDEFAMLSLEPDVAAARGAVERATRTQERRDETVSQSGGDQVGDQPGPLDTERGEVGEQHAGHPTATTRTPAIDEAARRWQFSPGRIDTVENGQDLDGDGKPDYTALIRTRPATVHYDLRFDLRIVDGQGQVEAAGDEKAPSPASGKGA